MEKKLYIFDLDGTLVDTVVDLNAGINYALNKHGYPTRSVEHTAHAIGNGIFVTLLRSLPLEDPEAANKLLPDFRAYYREHYLDNSVRYRGMLNTLKTLKKQGHLLAVATNKLNEIAQNMINTLYPNIFDIIQGDEDNLPKKPDPTIINSIIQDLVIEKENVIYVGDSEVDILTARNAEIQLVLVDYGFHRSDEFLSDNSGVHIKRPHRLLEIK